ncbi:hypothetical protein OVA11_05975 [Caulobacter sp. SL161]|uniref:hypothetical protein n=1 Tax=Caulobacter sp. SL161 TaxID=2995156 RepID=UPI0022754E02|nr:hypothetical protein [Caulobacter sp. SL161]MCY1646636.1 hypothetical protein [Caulobacter sp. SL161]
MKIAGYVTHSCAEWRPGAAARFAAFYVLARDVNGRLETHAQVDGRDVRVVFTTATAGALKLLATPADYDGGAQRRLSKSIFSLPASNVQFRELR